MKTKILSILIIAFTLFACDSDIEELVENVEDGLEHQQSESTKHPRNVDFFAINVTRDKWVYNTFWISQLNQWRLSVKEFPLVTYEWKSNDPNVFGIIVSQLDLGHLQNGNIYTNKHYKTYNASGSINFGMDKHVTGYFTLYVKTFDSNYVYSETSKKIEVYIESATYYEVYSLQPYL